MRKSTNRPSSDHQYITHDLLSLKDMEDNFKNSLFKSVLMPFSTSNTDQVLSLLPHKISNFWGYEVRLSKENVPDLLICINESQKHELRKNLKKNVFSSPEWGVVKSIVNKWSTPQSMYEHHILNVWLEFDQKDGAFPNPNFFLAPNPVLHASSVRKLVEQTFSDSLPQKIPAETLNIFELAYQKLPNTAWIPQVGMMLARNHSSIRAYIHKMPSNLLVKYLSQIRWGQAKHDFKQMLGNLLKFSDYVDLDLDIHESIGKTIGLECYLGTHPLNKIKSFLKYLCDIGYACELMSEKLLEYCQKQLSDATCGHREYLHHIKISYNPAVQGEAKAYLAIRKNGFLP